MMLRRFCFFFLLMLTSNVFAVIETYHFSDDAREKRYQTLVDELRCPKCQNQNLAGSNSPIAQDLRRELHRMIEAGNNDNAIKSFMVKRYGNFVLYRPPVDKHTIVLWCLPVILGFIGLMVVLLLRRQSETGDNQQALSVSEKAQLDAIIKKYR